MLCNFNEKKQISNLCILYTMKEKQKLQDPFNENCDFCLDIFTRRRYLYKVEELPQGQSIIVPSLWLVVFI